MRVILAAAMFAGFAASATAQETTTDATVAPSSCPAVPAPPAPPNGQRASAEQMNAAIAQYEAWNASTSAPLQCLANEVRTLQAQANARAAEHAAALAAGRETSAAWQAQVDAYQARQRR